RDATVTGVQTCALPIFPQYSAHTDANAGADTVVSLPYLTWPIVGYRLWQWDVQSLKSLTASAGCRAARFLCAARFPRLGCADPEDRKSTRLNSSHGSIS